MRGACGSRHALDADGVEVAAQQQRAPAARAARADEHARPAGRRLEHVGLQPGVARPAGDERGDLALAGAAGHERRVDGVDRDEVREEAGHVRHPAQASGSDSFTTSVPAFSGAWAPPAGTKRIG